MDKELNDGRKRVSIFNNNVFSKPKQVYRKVPLHFQLNKDTIPVLDHSLNDSNEDRHSSLSFQQQNSIQSDNRNRIFSIRQSYRDRSAANSSFEQSNDASSLSSFSKSRNHTIFGSTPTNKVYVGQSQRNRKRNDLKMNKQYSYQPNASIIFQNQDEMKQSILVKVPAKQYAVAEKHLIASTGLQQQNQAQKDDIMRPEQFAKLIKEVRCKPKTKHQQMKKVQISSHSTNNYHNSPFVTKFHQQYHNKP